ncbi:MAG: N-acetyltransferase family protein [Lapillicoccus sp.]
MTIRPATVADAAAVSAIYAPYVADTSITFELVPPTATQMRDRIATALMAHDWLVLEDETEGWEGTEGGGPRVVGYACAGEFRSRAAYRWSCEVSVYLERGRHRSGAGRSLYEALLPRLAARGYRQAVAGMTLPNDASLHFHAALGFEPVGTFRDVGWKHGRWHDVAFAQRALLVAPDPPAEPH